MKDPYERRLLEEADIASELGALSVMPFSEFVVGYLAWMAGYESVRHTMNPKKPEEMDRIPSPRDHTDLFVEFLLPKKPMFLSRAVDEQYFEVRRRLRRFGAAYGCGVQNSKVAEKKRAVRTEPLPPHVRSLFGIPPDADLKELETTLDFAPILGLTYADFVARFEQWTSMTRAKKHDPEEFVGEVLLPPVGGKMRSPSFYQKREQMELKLLDFARRWEEERGGVR